MQGSCQSGGEGRKGFGGRGVHRGSHRLALRKRWTAAAANTKKNIKIQINRETKGEDR